MKHIKAFVLFWYDFVVGDDWRIALYVVLALALTGALVHSGVNAWWLVPVVVAVVLALSVWRMTRGRRRA
jgi:hypothetical protein